MGEHDARPAVRDMRGPARAGRRRRALRAARMALGADADVLHRGAGIAATLRLLRRGGVCAELDDAALLDDVARGWGSGDAGAQVYVLRAIKEALGARVAREDPTLKAPAAARAESERRAADAAARAAAASARAARVADLKSRRRPVSALERLSGDAGLEELDAPREPTFDGLSTLRRLAGEASDDEGEAEDRTARRDVSGAPPTVRTSRFDADPGSETGSLRDWGRGDRAEERAALSETTRDGASDANRASDVSSASAYAAAADAAEAAARTYATRAEEARRARSAFLDDEAAARRAASSESPRLATSPEANDARRGFRGARHPQRTRRFADAARLSAGVGARRRARLAAHARAAGRGGVGPGAGRGGGRRRRRRRRRPGLPRATGIQAEMAKGALLCRLAETLEGAHLGDTHRRPKVKAEATHNINKALAVFRRAGRVAPRHLWSAADLAAGTRRARGVCSSTSAPRTTLASRRALRKRTPSRKRRCARPRARPRPARRRPAWTRGGGGIRRPQGRDRRRGGRGPVVAPDSAPFRERNIFSDVSVSPTSAPKAGASAGSSGASRARRAAHRARPALAAARAAAKAAAARA